MFISYDHLYIHYSKVIEHDLVNIIYVLFATDNNKPLDIITFVPFLITEFVINKR